MKRQTFKRSEWSLLLLPIVAYGALALSGPRSSLRGAWLMWRNNSHAEWQTLAWSSDSRFIAIGGGVEVLPLGPHGRQYLAPPVYARGDLEIRRPNGTLAHRMAKHESPLYNVEFSPDNTVLMAQDAAAVRLWDVPTGRERLQVDAKHSSLKWTKGGTALVGTQEQQTSPQSARRGTREPIRIDAVTGTIVALTATSGQAPLTPTSLPALQSSAGYLARPRLPHAAGGAYPGSQTSLTGETGADAVDILNAQGQLTTALHGRTVTGMAWRKGDAFAALCPISDSGRTVGFVIIRTNADGRDYTEHMLHLAPAEGLEPVSPYWRSYSVDPDAPYDGAFSPDGQRLAIWSYKTLWLLNSASDTPIVSWRVRGPSMGLFTAKFSPDSRYLAFVSEAQLQVVDAATGAVAHA